MEYLKLKTILEEDDDNWIVRFNVSEASLLLRYTSGELNRVVDGSSSGGSQTLVKQPLYFSIQFICARHSYDQVYLETLDGSDSKYNVSFATWNETDATVTAYHFIFCKDLEFEHLERNHLRAPEDVNYKIWGAEDTQHK